MYKECLRQGNNYFSCPNCCNKIIALENGGDGIVLKCVDRLCDYESMDLNVFMREREKVRVME